MCFEQILILICSKLDFVADCINKALIGENTTLAIETKVTSNPQCGFYFNNVYNVVT